MDQDDHYFDFEMEEEDSLVMGFNRGRKSNSYGKGLTERDISMSMQDLPFELSEMKKISKSNRSSH